MSYRQMQPRNGKIGHVLKIGRVSKPEQDQKSIEASYRYLDKIPPEVFDCTFEVLEMGEQGSGMLIERATIMAAYDLIEKRWPDLVLLEDVSKSYRNPRWIFAFVQDCVDNDVRVIAPGDNLDTYEENWEVALAAAALRHGLHIPDTRRRVRRSSAMSFSNGGMVLKVRYGYRKLSKEEAASGRFARVGLRMAVVATGTLVINTLREMVIKELAGGSVLARWLNDQKVAPGPYSKKKFWTGAMVLNLLRDPIMYGLRQFPKIKYEQRFYDGKHKRKKNPDPPGNLYEELAHMSKAEYEELQLALYEIGLRRRGQNRSSGENHPRYRVRRCDALVPLQHATCQICGAIYYLCGQGVAKCSRALGRDAGQTCWNHGQINVGLVRERIVDLLLSRVESAGVSGAFNKAIFTEVQRIRSRSDRTVDSTASEIKSLETKAERIAEAIGEGGQIKTLTSKLKEIEKQLAALRRQLKQQQEECPALPATAEQLTLDPRPTLIEMAATSFEFGQFVRKLIPVFEIQPVQDLDCGLVRPRGLLTLDLGALQPADTAPADRRPPESLVIDLFEPNVFIQHLPAVLKLHAAKLAAGEQVTLNILAAELGIGRMTVRRAKEYAALMQSHGMTEPYKVLTEKPASASRWKPRSARPAASLDGRAAQSSEPAAGLGAPSAIGPIPPLPKTG